MSQHRSGLRIRVKDFERQLIEAALQDKGGNVAAAAVKLDVQRTHLHNLMREYGIDPDKYRVHRRAQARNDLYKTSRIGRAAAERAQG